MDPINSARPNTSLGPIDAAAPRTLQQSTTAAGATLLPAPSAPGGGSNGADVGQMMAMMMIDAAFAQRKTAREAKAGTDSAMAEAQKQEINQLRQAADDKYDAARTDAWVQIGSGAVTVGAIGCQAAGAASGSAALMTTGDAVVQGMKLGGTDLAKGIGSVHSSGLRHDADNADATAKQSQYAASLMKSIGEEWSDDVSATKESVRKALDFLKDYQSAQTQAQAAALHRA